MNSVDFLRAVLGPDGTAALLKAAERATALGGALVPRTALALVKASASYEGTIPGLPDTTLSYRRTDAGFTGSISIGQELHKFEDISLFHLAASVTVAVDADRAPLSQEMRELDIVNLGKSIDGLAEVRARISKSDEDPDDALSDEDYKKKHGKERLKKAGMGMGKPAGAIAPAAPAAPTAKAPPPVASPMKPAATATAAESLPSAKPKGSSLKITKAEAAHACAMCGSAQLRGDVFTGCLCFRALQKSVTVTKIDDSGVTLQFKDWDRESVFALLEAVGRA